ncbi:hypothetical protein SLEP1_g38336 [Rubroshorea leprosula]|nr:hypothetical protein SLEP1_g38336 [Rubroshorea leprosula]
MQRADLRKLQSALGSKSAESWLQTLLSRLYGPEIQLLFWRGQKMEAELAPTL